MCGSQLIAHCPEDGRERHSLTINHIGGHFLYNILNLFSHLRASILFSTKILQQRDSICNEYPIAPITLSLIFGATPASLRDSRVKENIKLSICFTIVKLFGLPAGLPAGPRSHSRRISPASCGSRGSCVVL